jgi:hypothetical protein
LIGRDVFDHAAQVTQTASGVDQTGFFFANLAITNEFHARSLSGKIKW